MKMMTALVGAMMVGATPTFGQAPPSTVDLSVVIRDFTQDHPDFNVIPAVGYGFYFGNVAFDLDASGKPVFTGAGFRAARLWTDVKRNVIAPHLFNMCNFVGGPVADGDSGRSSFRITVAETVKIEKRSVVDSFDSNIGPYGGDNVGEAALIMANGSGKKRRYVRLKKRSRVMGDIMVHPDDNPAKAIKVGRRSSVSGERGNMESAAEITGVEVPEMDLGPSVGKVKYKGGERTITEDLHCKSLKLRKGAVLTVSGDVTIWCDKKLEIEDGSVLNIDGNVVIRCDDKFELDDRSHLRLMDEATLTMYVGHELKVDDRSMFNMNTGNPQLVSIMMTELDLDDDDDDDDHHGKRHRSRSKVKMDDGSMVAAWIQGAGTSLTVDDDSEFFGSFMGRTLKVSHRSRFHVDMATAGDSTVGVVVVEPEECDLGDNPGTMLTAATGDVTSADTFFEWWREVLGVNQSTVQTVRLVRDSAGVYWYINDDYRPINGMLFGNEGKAVNYHFTVAIDASFTYAADAGQWFEIRCTDDAYLFINGRLVLDLGGYGYNKVMYIDMDRLGLPDGETAQLQLFHAQRQQGLAIFRLRTNIVMSDNGASPSISGVLED